MVIESKKLVSIIMPTYNGSRYISRAIKSIFDQTYTKWELIIVNDGSTDNTEDIVKEFQKLDNRILYFKNDKNLGVERTRNRCLKESRGYYIACLDDDDIWCVKDKLEKQIDFFDKNPDYVLVGTGVIVKNEEGKELSRKIGYQNDSDIRQNILINNCFTNSSILYKKDIALSLGGYSELKKDRYIEDYDLHLKLGTVGKFCNLPIYTTVYCVRKGSICSVNELIQIKRCFSLIKEYKKYYPNYFSAFIFLILRLMFFYYKYLFY